jgi:hypothetical protein
MTADERATLAKVAELLAEAKYDFGSSEVNRDTLTAMRELSEALALLRGLLAEPQPGEIKNDSALTDAYLKGLAAGRSEDFPAKRFELTDDEPEGSGPFGF